MQASELIQKLQEQIDSVGDLTIIGLEYTGEVDVIYVNDYDVNFNSRRNYLELVSTNWWEDDADIAGEGVKNV